MVFSLFTLLVLALPDLVLILCVIIPIFIPLLFLLLPLVHAYPYILIIYGTFCYKRTPKYLNVTLAILIVSLIGFYLPYYLNQQTKEEMHKSISWDITEKYQGEKVNRILLHEPGKNTYSPDQIKYLCDYVCEKILVNSIAHEVIVAPKADLNNAYLFALNKNLCTPYNHSGEHYNFDKNCLTATTILKSNIDKIDISIREEDNSYLFDRSFYTHSVIIEQNNVTPVKLLLKQTKSSTYMLSYPLSYGPKSKRGGDFGYTNALRSEEYTIGENESTYDLLIQTLNLNTNTK